MFNSKDEDSFNNKIYKVDYDRGFLNKEIYSDEFKEDSSPSVRRIACISALICVIVLFSLFLIFGGEKNFVKENKHSFLSNLFSNKNKNSFSPSFGHKRQNLLILGVDDNPDSNDMWHGTRTDTIIVASIDPKTKNINAISIPRDSKVYIAGNKGINKINSAHAIGGIDTTKKTIEKTLGIKIHRYIMVHEGIVKELVDALGGVDIYIEKPMQYTDKTAHLRINFSTGQQVLDGQKAVEYLRFRHDRMGDIGRTQRQQWFLRALVKKLQTPSVLPKIPDLITLTKKYVKTDLNAGEIAHYVEILRHVDLSKSEIATLPGTPNQKGYVSYWILDPEKTQEVIDRLIYRDKAKFDNEKPIVANIMYAKGKKSKAEALKLELNRENIEIKCFEPIKRTHAQFVAHSTRISNEYFNSLNEKIENIDKIQFVYDPINLYCAATDFTIILAEE